MNEKDLFIDKMTERFPSIKDDVLDEDMSGLFYLQVGVLKHFIQEKIDEDDSSLFVQAVEFLESSLGAFGHEVDNAIYTSVLEHLNFKKSPKLAKMLSSKLRGAYGQLLKYNAKSRNPPTGFK